MGADVEGADVVGADVEGADVEGLFPFAVFNDSLSLTGLRPG